MNSDTRKRLEEIEAVEKKMTPGEWRVDGKGFVLSTVSESDDPRVAYFYGDFAGRTEVQRHDNSRGTAMLRNEAPWLISALREALEENERLETLIQKIIATVNILPSVTHSPITDPKDIVYAIRDLQQCYGDAARARNGLIAGEEFVAMRKRAEAAESKLTERKEPTHDPL